MLKQNISAFLEQDVSFWKHRDKKKNRGDSFLFWHQFFLPVHFTHQSAALGADLGVVSAPLRTHFAAVSPPLAPLCLSPCSAKT